MLVENPQLSYLWLMRDMLVLIGLKGLYLVRIDQCCHGTPYQKPQVWLTTNPELARFAKKCYHPKHVESLVGSKTRQSAPYPKELCEDLITSFVDLQQSGETVSPQLRKDAQQVLSRLYGKKELDFLDEATTIDPDDEFIAHLRKVGLHIVTRLRTGTLSLTAQDVDELVEDPNALQQV